MSRLEELIQELCPNGVEYKTIQETVGLNRGSRLVKSQLSDDFEYEVYHGSKDTLLGKYSSFNAPANTTIVVNTGGIGGVKFIDKPFWCSDGSFWLGHCEYINDKFLYYCLAGYEDYFASKKRVGGVPTIDRDVVESFKIPVPPMEVQCEIVHILDKFTLLTAELTAELTARKQQYDCYRNKLIDEVIGRKGKLIELLIQPVTDGPHTTPKLFKEGVPFVSATAVYDGKVHLNDMKGYISKEFDEECARKYKPKKFDIYMVKSGSTTGKVAIVDFNEDFNIWSPLAALRTGSETQAWYLYHLLQTSNVQEQVLSRMSQGSQPNLSMRVIEQFDVVIPSIDEQERIVNILNKFDTYCNDLTQGLPAEIELRKQQYEYYRDKLLTFKELN